MKMKFWLLGSNPDRQMGSGWPWIWIQLSVVSGPFGLSWDWWLSDAAFSGNNIFSQQQWLQRYSKNIGFVWWFFFFYVSFVSTRSSEFSANDHLSGVCSVPALKCWFIPSFNERLDAINGQKAAGSCGWRRRTSLA